ncbi:MAG: hypothetical protein E3J69_02075 [Anaerolineales bacterium]|nr:MAG: hypothetical protein E3J69_02075 [Anaerolineales bacterium]
MGYVWTSVVYQFNYDWALLDNDKARRDRILSIVGDVNLISLLSITDEFGIADLLVLMINLAAIFYSLRTRYSTFVETRPTQKKVEPNRAYSISRMELCCVLSVFRGQRMPPEIKAPERAFITRQVTFHSANLAPGCIIHRENA